MAGITPEPIDYKALEFWFTVGQWGFNLLIALYLWISRKNTATNQRVDTLGEKVDAVEKDIVKIRADLDHLPDQDQFGRLGREITALTKELGEVKGRLGGINRAVDLINEFLINQGNRK